MMVLGIVMMVWGGLVVFLGGGEKEMSKCVSEVVE